MTVRDSEGPRPMRVVRWSRTATGTLTTVSGSVATVMPARCAFHPRSFSMRHTRPLRNGSWAPRVVRKYENQGCADLEGDGKHSPGKRGDRRHGRPVPPGP